MKNIKYFLIFILALSCKKDSKVDEIVCNGFCNAFFNTERWQGTTCIFLNLGTSKNNCLLDTCLTFNFYNKDKGLLSFKYIPYKVGKYIFKPEDFIANGDPINLINSAQVTYSEGDGDLIYGYYSLLKSDSLYFINIEKLIKPTGEISGNFNIKVSRDTFIKGIPEYINISSGSFDGKVKSQ